MCCVSFCICLYIFYTFVLLGCENHFNIQLFRERLSQRNVHATIPKGNMGYDQYSVPDDCSCRTYFCCFPLALANTFPWPFLPILSNFFEKQRTQNHPQCFSGLSRALSFPATFLEIAVYATLSVETVNHRYLNDFLPCRLQNFLHL